MSGYIPDWGDPVEADNSITPEEERIERLKRKYAECQHDLPRFTQWLYNSARESRAYLHGRALYTGNDPEKLRERDEAAESIYKMHKNAAIEKMKQLNADTGKLNTCKYCHGKGYTVGLRDGIELVAHACSCMPPKRK